MAFADGPDPEGPVWTAALAAVQCVSLLPCAYAVAADEREIFSDIPRRGRCRHRGVHRLHRCPGENPNLGWGVDLWASISPFRVAGRVASVHSASRFAD